MPGWSPTKVQNFRDQFYQFLGHVQINSKDYGQVILGDHIYESQHRFMNAIFTSLGQGIHDIKHLKSRQLGISTLTWAFDLFWLGMFDGLEGVLILDHEGNKEKARNSIIMMLDSLPKHLKFPSRDKRDGGQSNRYSLRLSNQSSLFMLSAGVSARKTGGGLGRSLGVNFVHACMHPDTKVLVGHGRIKRIEDVLVGDSVITHSGKLAKVIANVGQPNTRGDMIRISPWLGEPIVCTADHKIMTNFGLVRADKIAKHHKLIMPVRKITNDCHSDYLPETQARAQNGGAISAGSGARIFFTEEVGFAVGYYLAEGCVVYNGRGENYGKNPSGIIFTRHRDEKDYTDRAIKALVQYTSGVRTTVDVKKCLTTTEHIYGSSLARWIELRFGSVDSKRIPDEVFSYGKDFCRGLLAGLLSGDGSKSETICQGYVVNRVQLSSTRASIAFQIRDLAASLGFGWGSWATRAAGQWYGRNCKQIWTIQWSGAGAGGLRELMGLEAAPATRNRGMKWQQVEDKIHINIRSIETGIKQEIMYDLSVDHEDHTFRTPSGAVSNSELCNWENIEGLESFRNSLSTEFENRLYLWESPLALTTPVLTLQGWTTLGEVQTGDYVFDENGQPTKVIGLSPIFYDRKCYEIEFSNGEKIISDGVHKWQVARKHLRDKFWSTCVVSTLQLDTVKDRILLGGPVNTYKEQLPIHPYVVGAWLGDGHSAAARITCGDQDMEEMRKKLEACGVTCGPITTHKNRGGGVFNLCNQIGIFRSINLIDNKHIPEIYLRSSIEDRLELLRGLMDTDGSIVVEGNCLFSNSSEVLVNGMCELLATLGIKYRLSWIPGGVKKFSNGQDYEYRPCAGINFNPPRGMRVFSLPRKVIRQTNAESRQQSRRSLTISVVSVKECPSVPVRCLAVNTPTHLFKVGKTLIPTHNTGRGFNSWYQMWNEAREDPFHQCCHFTGWWGKNSQKIIRSDPDFARYGWPELSPEEKDRIKDLEDRYGWTLSIEQLAWYRRHMNPAAAITGEKIVEASSLKLMEQPWTEDDAFQSGESIFFDPKVLSEKAKSEGSIKHKNFFYYCGLDFLSMKVTPSPNHKSIQLKVWEDPDPDGVYIISVDPAYGANENNDRSAIQVMRCYADGLDQVAEYAWPLINTEQLAWVIAHLLGWYSNCYFVIELNGPGDAVWRYLKAMKKDVTRGVLMGMPMNDDFVNIFAHVKNFIYSKSDTFFVGRCLHFKTNYDVKVTLMETLRDFTQNGMLKIRSLPALEEMKTMERKGGAIAASSDNKDDRVLSLSFAVHYWNDSIRAKLVPMKITRENVIAKRRLTITDMYSTFTSYQINDMFKKKADAKLAAVRAARRRR